jgi:hypothetical protein
MQQPPVTDSRATVVKESRSQIGFLSGFLALACAVAAIRGVAGASTGAGRVAVGVVFGALVVVFVAGWIWMVRRPARLEITEATISYVKRGGQASALSREWGDELQFVQRRNGRTSTLGLTIAGTGTIIFLGFFSRKAIRQACLARGWRVSDQTMRQS